MYQVCTVFLSRRTGAARWHSLPRIRYTNAFGLDILPLVLILFAISVACSLALIGTAAAIVRHVRANHRGSRITAPPQPSFGEHFQAAAKYGAIRSSRLVPHQTVQGITARKSWNTSSQTVEIHPAAEQPSVFGKRKSPQSDHAPERADWDSYTSRPRTASATRATTSKRI
jgi:hypothetical protein